MLQSRRPAAALATFFAALCALPSHAQSLCNASEKSLFNCQVGKKTLSVCASTDLDDTKGVMQYRFGTAEKIELAFPEKLAHPNKHFTANRLYSRVEGSLIMELAFRRGNVSYTVFTHDLRGKKSAGVTVNVKGKDTELACKDTEGTAAFESSIDGLNLPEAK